MERTKTEIEEKIEETKREIEECKEQINELNDDIYELTEELKEIVDYQELEEVSNIEELRDNCEELISKLYDRENSESDLEDLEQELEDLEQELEDFNYETIEKMLEEKIHMTVSIHEDYINFEISRMGFDFIAMINIDMKKFNWKDLRIKVLQEQKEQLQAYIDNIENCTYDAYEFVENEFMNIVKAITEIIEKEGD